MQNRYHASTTSYLHTKHQNKKKTGSACTNTETIAEEKCHLPGTENFRETYISSLNYINSCHTILNKLLHQDNPPHQATLPEVPNFLHVFAALQGGSGGTIKEASKEEEASFENHKKTERRFNIKTTKALEDGSGSSLTDEDFDRCAQELLESTKCTPRKNASPNFSALPSISSSPVYYAENRLKVLRKQPEDHSSDTECIPSDNETVSRALNQRSLHLLDETVVSRMSLYSKKDEIKLDTMKALEAEDSFRLEAESSDTDYLPSDNEVELVKTKTNIPISHPLMLNQRSLHLLDETVVSRMGLYTKKGELKEDTLKVLEAEGSCRSKAARNRQFRRKRSESDNNLDKHEHEGSTDLSDIKSESEVEGSQDPAPVKTKPRIRFMQ